MTDGLLFFGGLCDLYPHGKAGSPIAMKNHRLLLAFCLAFSGSFAFEGAASAQTPPYIPTPHVPEARIEKPKVMVLPAALRGGIGLETASFTYSEGDFSAVALGLVASVPLTRADFLDARLPMGLTMRTRTNAVLGNLEVGYHRILRPAKRVWLTLGASLGLPMIQSESQKQDNYEAPSAALAHYRLQDYLPETVPMGFQFGGEWLAGPFILRGELKLVGCFAGGRNGEPELIVPHSVEIQYGQRVGVGLRLQGVGLPTFGEIDMAHSIEGHLYQAAVEPFFVFEGKPMFLRLGLMMPLDEPLGPPFVDAWGFRMGVGVRVE